MGVWRGSVVTRRTVLPMFTSTSLIPPCLAVPPARVGRVSLAAPEGCACSSIACSGSMQPLQARQSVVGVAVVVGFIGFLFLLLLLLISSEQLPRRRVLARLGQGGGKWLLICHISPFPPYSTLLGADRAG